VPRTFFVYKRTQKLEILLRWRGGINRFVKIIFLSMFKMGNKRKEEGGA